MSNPQIIVILLYKQYFERSSYNFNTVKFFHVINVINAHLEFDNAIQRFSGTWTCLI